MKRTALYSKHLEAGGRMIHFAGWEMPVYYSSIIQEHLNVRHRSGLFDVSHMGEILIKGRQGLQYLQALSCNDLSKIQRGQAQYNLILNPKGGVVDDVLIYLCDEGEFFMVCNAANHDKVYAYLKECKSSSKLDVQIIDESEKWQQLALQGPLAETILEDVIQENLSEIRYFHFKDFSLKHGFLRVSRTGYTGEDGFELYGDAAMILWLWEKFSERIKTQEVLPVGLGARDSLRLEALYPLYGQELNAEWTPIESGLSWAAKPQDPPYLGYERIMQHKHSQGTKEGAEMEKAPGRVFGFQLEGPALARSGYAVWNQEKTKQISQVLSAAYSPILKTGIGTLYLPAEYTKDKKVHIEIRGKTAAAHLRSSPFVQLSAGKVKDTSAAPRP